MKEYQELPASADQRYLRRVVDGAAVLRVEASLAAWLAAGNTPDPADPLPPLPPDLQDASLAQLDTDMAAAANLADAKAALRKFAQAFRQARKS